MRLTDAHIAAGIQAEVQRNVGRCSQAACQFENANTIPAATDAPVEAPNLRSNPKVKRPASARCSHAVTAKAFAVGMNQKGALPG